MEQAKFNQYTIEDIIGRYVIVAKNGGFSIGDTYDSFIGIEHDYPGLIHSTLVFKRGKLV